MKNLKKEERDEEEEWGVGVGHGQREIDGQESEICCDVLLLVALIGRAYSFLKMMLSR